MLTMKAQYSLRNAESYFREHLGVGDYYMKGQMVSGQWFGEGARELGLSGVTTEKEFLNLCNNLHPQIIQLETFNPVASRATKPLIFLITRLRPACAGVKMKPRLAA